MKSPSNKIVPRLYQQEAVKAARDALLQRPRVLVISPTASGKSVMIAMIVDAAMQSDKARGRHTRILVLCHQGHLLTQNEAQIKRFGDYDTGVYCAGEGRKESDAQIVLASRDSLARKPDICGHRDIVLCDEAHTIEPSVLNEENRTQYSKILRVYYESHVIGFTGTPWRLANGRIWGPDSFFQVVAYNIEMETLIKEGFLVPYRLPATSVKTIDVSGVRKQHGEYVTSELEKVSSTEEIVGASLQHWKEHAEGRKCSLFFCCSVAHARLVANMLVEHIPQDEILMVAGDMVGDERKHEFKRIVAGHYRAVVNMGVLTTGFDAPIIDCVVYLRATASASLFVQMAGRGLRTFDDKEDLLVLDMAGNFERFKGIEKPFVQVGKSWDSFDQDDETEGETPAEAELCKKCPECKATMHIAKTVCEFCLHVFVNHDTTSATENGEFEMTVLRHVCFPSKTRAGDDCYILEIWGTFERRRRFRKWLLHERETEWGREARKTLNILKTHRPYLVRVNTKGKYPDVKILKWIKDKTNLCDHSNSDVYEEDGKTHYICRDCNEYRT